MDKRKAKWIPRVKRICETCGMEFERRVIDVKNNGGRFCSKKCSKNRKEVTEQRIKCICETCGKEFYVSPSIIRQGRGKHCSQECRKKQIVHTCVECGIQFEKPPSATGKFCSLKCQITWREKNAPKGKDASNWQGGKIKRICKQCGKVFEVFKNKITINEGNFCSRKCNAVYHMVKGKENPHYNRKDIPCKRCGKIVHATQYRIKTRENIYCSTTCRDLWVSEHPGKEHPSFNSKYVDCIICGKEFKLTPHWEKLGRTKYCSQECYWKDLMVGGTREYCIKWTPELRQRITLFWNNKCSVCGTVQPVEERVFHRHHVYYNKESCCIKNEHGTFSNLGIAKNPHDFMIIGTPNKFALLCPKCHARSSIKKNRVSYTRQLEELINSKYNGKSYYSPEEMIRIGYELAARNKWVLKEKIISSTSQIISCEVI